jgi:hypothetical protein
MRKGYRMSARGQAVSPVNERARPLLASTAVAAHRGPVIYTTRVGTSPSQSNNDYEKKETYLW